MWYITLINWKTEKMTISIDAERAFDKNSETIYNKNSLKSGHRDYISQHNTHQKWHTANILNGEKLEVFPLRPEIK